MVLQISTDLLEVNCTLLIQNFLCWFTKTSPMVIPFIALVVVIGVVIAYLVFSGRDTDRGNRGAE